jgi:hypothetical protein
MVPYRTIAYIKTRNGEKTLVQGEYQAEMAVHAVLMLRSDYTALLKLERKYWKLKKKYNEAMNNSL